MTRAEARKMARLESENESLRALLDWKHERAIQAIKEETACRIAIKEIGIIIDEVRKVMYG